MELQADKSQYDYRPKWQIDSTEYKWQFEDVKPLNNYTMPLQFLMDDRPYLFCPREVELHLGYFSSRVPSKHPHTPPAAVQSLLDL